MNSWQTKKLGEVCNFQSGLWKGKEPPYIKVGVIRNTNFTKDGKLDDSNIAYLDIEKKQFERRQLIYGDIILEKSGGGPKQPVGRVIIFDKKKGDYSFSNFTAVIRIKDKHQLSFNFLHKYLYFLYSSGITEGMQSHSTGIRNLDLNRYKEIEIPLPLLSEQKRIVKILAEVFDKIAKAKENAEKNLQNSRELFESYLQNVFANPGKDWEEKKLKEIGQTQTGLTPSTSNKSYFGNSIPFIKPADVDIDGSGSIQYNNEGLSSNGLMVGRKIKKDSVLMVCIGASIGKVGFSDRDVSCNQQINTLSPKSDYKPRFFYYALRTKNFFNKIIRNSSQATLPIINKSKWENLTVAFPKSSAKQEMIVQKLDSLSEQTKKLENNYQQKLDDLEELKKSVLNKAFKGKS